VLFPKIREISPLIDPTRTSTTSPLVKHMKDKSSGKIPSFCLLIIWLFHATKFYVTYAVILDFLHVIGTTYFISQAFFSFLHNCPSFGKNLANGFSKEKCFSERKGYEKIAVELEG